ncbi:MAG TPA: hypothetical protein VKC56_00340 [Gallionellaceae bacterium]|nr:hypothetical protein [Gallionellaceae bacterium]
MTHKPGHLQFDQSLPRPAVARTPGAVEFGDAGTGAGERPATQQQRGAAHVPARAFGDGGISITPALEQARAAFPDLARSHEHSLEVKLRQLVPWRHEVIAGWGGNALDKNAAATSSVAQLISRLADYGIDRLVEDAMAMAQRGSSSLLHRLFLRGRIISKKPSLTVAKSQLTRLLKECADTAAVAEPLTVQLRLNLVALASAIDAFPKPADHALEATLASRRTLLQQSIHQAELTALQLKELKQQLATLLHSVDQLLAITIPAFEIADAAK